MGGTPFLNWNKPLIKSFPLNSRCQLWRSPLVYVMIILSLPTPEPRKNICQILNLKAWWGPQKQSDPKTAVPRNFLLSCQTILSLQLFLKLLLECSYQFVAPATSVPGKLISAVFLWICLSLQISWWKFASSFLKHIRNVISFSFVQLYHIVRMAVMISKLFTCQILNHK